MGCGCGGGKKSVVRQYKVDLPEGAKFADGTSSKTFASAAEANIAIARIGLTGKVRPVLVQTNQ